MLTDLSRDESKRLAAIDLLKNPDKGRDDALKKYTHLICQLLNMPMGFVSVIDEEKQYIKSAQNVAVTEISLSEAFCVQTQEQSKTFICHDTHQHPTFRDYHAVKEAPFIRFYAGCPLKTQDGVPIGTLCILDTQPRELSDEQLDLFEKIAGLISDFLASWHSVGYLDIVTLLPNRQRLLKDIEVSTEGAFRLVIIDCIDMPLAYEMARSLGMTAVENLLRNMVAELQIRLPLEGPLYAVAVGRFAFFTHKEKIRTLEDISQSLQGIQARFTPEVPLDLDIHMGDSGLCDKSLTSNEILRRAVSALHEGISQGRRFTVYDDALDSRKKTDFSLLTEVRQALQENQGLYLVYQPKISLVTGRVTGAEALLRWQHPKNGEVLPGVFIPLVEKTSLMRELTAWVIDHTIVQLSAWQSRGVSLPVSINLAASDFSRPDFCDELEQKMLDARLDPALLGVECLETEKMLESPAALIGLDMLKQRGFKISLDDFGSGYSNINYLRQIPMDIIKLDRSIVSKVAGDNASRIIVRNVITLLKQLDYIVLAEGVEDARTVDILRRLGCDEVQGYFFAKPMTPDAFETWYHGRDEALK
ncbi:TPA: sensor domain-containing phosphodiesterase [Raoultella ornithinolytica]|uniref:sensor domain-containing phosphodiesterase n=1 Tax=Raoultella planticola TaxID=575 RepID=UPI0004E3B9FE|nr:EAL domain-containing protein [Raoultella planticola]KFD01818.1 diguanylate cyclase/phosphodiesterase [Raoultella planticola ATCC 33531]